MVFPTNNVKASGLSPAFRSWQNGFTLLEICLSVFIISIILLGALPATSSWITEKKLRGPSGQLEEWAKVARREALTRQETFKIVFTPKEWQLKSSWIPPEERPVPQEEENSTIPDTNLPQTDEADPALVPEQPWTTETYSVPQHVECWILRWGETKWEKISENTWSFQPSGMCEPISIRLVSGKAWIEFRFHPLTASVIEERYEFE